MPSGLCVFPAGFAHQWNPAPLLVWATNWCEIIWLWNWNGYIIIIYNIIWCYCVDLERIYALQCGTKQIGILKTHQITGHFFIHFYTAASWKSRKVCVATKGNMSKWTAGLFQMMLVANLYNEAWWSNPVLQLQTSVWLHNINNFTCTKTYFFKLVCQSVPQTQRNI